MTLVITADSGAHGCFECLPVDEEPLDPTIFKGRGKLAASAEVEILRRPSWRSVWLHCASTNRQIAISRARVPRWEFPCGNYQTGLRARIFYIGLVTTACLPCVARALGSKTDGIRSATHCPLINEAPVNYAHNFKVQPTHF